MKDFGYGFGIQGVGVRVGFGLWVFICCLFGGGGWGVGGWRGGRLKLLIKTVKIKQKVFSVFRPS